MNAAGLVGRPVYRVRQILWSLRPRVTQEESRQAHDVLGDDLFAAFEAMDAPDKRHCLDVYRAAREMGCEDRATLMAALIHDCGKALDAEDGRLRLWHRVAYVALHAVAPGLLRRLARRPGGLRLLDRHVERGIEIAKAHGAGPEVLELIRRMEDKGDGDERARLLREADDRA